MWKYETKLHTLKIMKFIVPGDWEVICSYFQESKKQIITFNPGLIYYQYFFWKIALKGSLEHGREQKAKTTKHKVGDSG